MAGEFLPEGDNNALLLEGCDDRDRSFVVDYLMGRDGLVPYMRGGALFLRSDREISASTVEMVNLILSTVRETCRSLVCRTVPNLLEAGDIVFNLDLDTVGFPRVDRPLRTDVKGRVVEATPVVPILSFEDFASESVVNPALQDGPPTLRDEFPPALVALKRGEFCVLDGKTLVVNIENFSETAVENLRLYLLEMEIPGVGGGVNDRSMFVMPTRIGNYLFFEFNRFVNVNDGAINMQLGEIIHAELILFAGLEREFG